MILIFTDTPSSSLRTIGAYRIATELRRYGCDVEVIDYLSNWKEDELLKFVDSFNNIEWVGISTKFFVSNPDIKNYNNPTIKNSAGILTQMKRNDEKAFVEYFKNRKIPIVIGGPSAEIVIPHVKGIDVVCVGYADKAVLAVHDHIVKGKDLIYTRVNNSKVVYCNNDYGDIDLTKIDTELVDSDFVEQGENLPVEIGRGCIFHCAFCTYSHIGKKPGTYIRDKESIKKDILERYTKYGTTSFRFSEDTLNDSVEKMKMLKEIRDETVPYEFWAYGRLDLLAAKPEMVDLIPQIGWKYLTFGIETLNRSAGSAVGKGGNPEKLKQCLVDMKEKYPDLFFTCNLIIGLPNDTPEDIEQTVQWFIDNPGIADRLKMSPLGIPNPKIEVYSSKMSKDPKKYGYKILGEQPVRLMWRSKIMDWKFATHLAERLSEKVHKELEIETNIRITWKHSKEIGMMEDGGVEDQHKQQMRRYIEKKLKAREL